MEPTPTPHIWQSTHSALRLKQKKGVELYGAGFNKITCHASPLASFDFNFTSDPSGEVRYLRATRQKRGNRTWLPHHVSILPLNFRSLNLFKQGHHLNITSIAKEASLNPCTTTYIQHSATPHQQRLSIAACSPKPGSTGQSSPGAPKNSSSTFMTRTGST